MFFSLDKIVFDSKSKKFSLSLIPICKFGSNHTHTLMDISMIKSRFPLHYFAWNNDHAALRQYLTQHSIDHEAMRPVLEQKDTRGRTALLLAATLAHVECVHLLLEHHANVDAKDAEGFDVLHETIASAQPNVDRALVRDVYRAKLSRRIDANRRLMSCLVAQSRTIPDFYLELKWHFTSWIPLISGRIPSDTFKIYKRGASLRVDMTLVDVDLRGLLPKSIRGNRSILFIASDNNCSIYEVDHETKRIAHESIDFTRSLTLTPSTAVSSNQTAENDKTKTTASSPDSNQLEDEKIENLKLDQLLSSPITIIENDLDQITFEPAEKASTAAAAAAAATNTLNRAVRFLLKPFLRERSSKSKSRSSSSRPVEDKNKTTATPTTATPTTATPTTATPTTATPTTATPTTTTPTTATPTTATTPTPTPTAITSGFAPATKMVDQHRCHVYSIKKFRVRLKRRVEHLNRFASKDRNPHRLTLVKYFNETSPSIAAAADIGVKRELKMYRKKFKIKIWQAQQFPLAFGELFPPLARVFTLERSAKTRQCVEEIVSRKFPPGFPVKLVANIFRILKAHVTIENIFATKRSVAGVHAIADDRQNLICRLDDSCFAIPGDYQIVDTLSKSSICSLAVPPTTAATPTTS